MTTIQQDPKHSRGKRKQKSVFQRVFVPLLLVLVGVGIMLYPVISSTWNNFAQQKVTAQYEELLKDTDPETLNAAIEAAHEFNREHTPGPILDPWDAHASEDNELYALYLSQFSGQPAMSQVVIPSIDSQLPVYHGTSEKVLQRGLGHLFGSALPVGGEGTHSVITGHTGLTNATLWDNLIDVKEGDAIYISTFGERLKYEVHGIDIVLPNETDSLAPRPGEDLITLITCTPYGVNTHRLLVHAHRVPMDPEDEGVFEDTGFNMQWWMWVLLAVALIVLLLLIWWIRRMIKRSKENAPQQSGEA